MASRAVKPFQKCSASRENLLMNNPKRKIKSPNRKTRCPNDVWTLTFPFVELYMERIVIKNKEALGLFNSRRVFTSLLGHGLNEFEWFQFFLSHCFYSQDSFFKWGWKRRSAAIIYSKTLQVNRAVVIYGRHLVFFPSYNYEELGVATLKRISRFLLLLSQGKLLFKTSYPPSVMADF